MHVGQLSSGHKGSVVRSRGSSHIMELCPDQSAKMPGNGTDWSGRASESVLQDMISCTEVA